MGPLRCVLSLRTDRECHFLLSVASQIMDPKMDSGCLAPGESLDEDYDVTKPLSPEEALGVIDQLLCHEVGRSPAIRRSTCSNVQQMAWHLGYPLSQTLFTNVYIEALLMPFPKTVDEAHFIRDGQGALDYSVMDKNPVASILRAYCLGLLKCCHFVNERIRSEHYYEVNKYRLDSPVGDELTRKRRRTSLQTRTTDRC